MLRSTKKGFTGFLNFIVDFSKAKDEMSGTGRVAELQLPFCWLVAPELSPLKATTICNLLLQMELLSSRPSCGTQWKIHTGEVTILAGIKPDYSCNQSHTQQRLPIHGVDAAPTQEKRQNLKMQMAHWISCNGWMPSQCHQCQELRITHQVWPLEVSQVYHWCVRC